MQMWLQLRPFGRAGRVLGAGVLATVLLSGCGFLGSREGGCVDTDLVAHDVAAEDEAEPLQLSGVLTAAGEPVEGADLGFFMHREDENGDVRVLSVGSAETDAGGVAVRPYQGGSRDIAAFSSEVVVGYSVEFRQINLINGVRYCSARSGIAQLDVPCAGFACRWGD